MFIDEKKNQPDDFDHLFEWWLIEREKTGNMPALEMLEKDYPQFGRQLSVEVFAFLDMEDAVKDADEKELTEAEEKRLGEMMQNALREVRRKFFWSDVIE